MLDRRLSSKCILNLISMNGTETELLWRRGSRGDQLPCERDFSVKYIAFREVLNPCPFLQDVRLLDVQADPELER